MNLWLCSACLPLLLVAPAIAATASGASSASDTAARSDASAAQRPLRIVAIGGDVTEILYRLGMGDRIVAVDSTSQFPEQALKQKANVGYMRALSPESVLSVGATLILASDGAGPAESVRALKASTARYIAIPEPRSADGIAVKIARVAEAVGLQSEGADLAADVTRRLLELDGERASIKRRMRVLFVLNISGSRMVVGGRDTSADALLALAGAENAASKLNGYKPITEEGLLSMAPDAIIVMQRRDSGEDIAALQAVPAVMSTPAGRSGRLRSMNGLYLLGLGPRTPDAAREVMHWLYPELAERR